MLLAAFTLYWAVADWRGDLVEARRRVRAAVVFIISLNVIAVSLLLRLVIPWDTAANYHGYVAFAVLNLATSVFLLLSLRDDDLRRYLEPAREAPLPRPAGDTQTAQALARLNALFEKDYIHREPGLSLKALADRVGLPEYRLRRLIHEHLGYKNFNAFLHSWRIRDACVQLRDPALRRTPILTIALSLGYQSVTTFNRGFVEITGMTPSAWRAENGGEN
jgi:AraC-like DNA-binding protein